MANERMGLMEGKMHVSEYYYLMGTADPTGLLNSDEVCIIMDKGKIVGEVLVYRNHGLHFGDRHVLQATYVKELENIVGNAKYTIFFPTKGPRSLVAEISNGDFEATCIGYAPKSRKKVIIPKDLMAKKFPHFMKKWNSCNSKSILGQIHDKVESFKSLELHSKEIWKLLYFSGEVEESCLLLWKGHYDQYRTEMKHALEIDQEIKNEAANGVKQKYKQILYGATEFEESP
ncbi:hypothetical protein GIB67_028147 [Kingdonia uniflora]|uniref:RNA-dependent RNA polymerase n=1 Tax=Kingdonia uniflora TaxID=39325 RepID=A0A7J7KZR7_9MAGN|nr:hypothetical protein GIB67_028147 [Kingdonia uniflora]